MEEGSSLPFLGMLVFWAFVLLANSRLLLRAYFTEHDAGLPLDLPFGLGTGGGLFWTEVKPCFYLAYIEAEQLQPIPSFTYDMLSLLPIPEE